MVQGQRYIISRFKGADMGLGSLKLWRITPLDKHAYFAAEEVIPCFHTKGTNAPKYRQMLLAKYKDLEGSPPKRNGNGELRSEDQSRLDRSWTRVAEAADCSENNIRECVLSIYDDIDLQAARVRAEKENDKQKLDEIDYYMSLNRPDWLIIDFNEILKKATERRNQADG